MTQSTVNLKVVRKQSAEVLLTAVFDFLRRNDIDADWIADFSQHQLQSSQPRAKSGAFRSMLRIYEDMSMVMATWFTDPRFLDGSGKPKALHSKSSDGVSVAQLVRAASVRISAKLATQLLIQSSSIRSQADGKLIPIRRPYTLPGFEVPRAAFVIERFLDTLRQNSSINPVKPLLETSCYVTKLNRKSVAPILRDLKERGGSFMNSVAGEIESQRIKNGNQNTSELGLFTFAWAKASKTTTKQNLRSVGRNKN